MSDNDGLILKRIKALESYRQALERAPEEERQQIEKKFEHVASKFDLLIAKLYAISQDPKLSESLREELLRIAKDPTKKG
jgi:hypothetical protein